MDVQFCHQHALESLETSVKNSASQPGSRKLALSLRPLYSFVHRVCFSKPPCHATGVVEVKVHHLLRDELQSNESFLTFLTCVLHLLCVMQPYQVLTPSHGFTRESTSWPPTSRLDRHPSGAEPEPNATEKTMQAAGGGRRAAGSVPPARFQPAGGTGVEPVTRGRLGLLLAILPGLQGKLHPLLSQVKEVTHHPNGVVIHQESTLPERIIMNHPWLGGWHGHDLGRRTMKSKRNGCSPQEPMDDVLKCLLEKLCSS